MKEAADARLHGRPRQRPPSRPGSRFETRATFPSHRPSPRSETPVDAGHGGRARRGISQITPHDFDAQSVEKIGAAIRANQCPDVLAPGLQSFNQMTSQEARRPGDQSAAVAKGRAAFSM